LGVTAGLISGDEHGGQHNNQNPTQVPPAGLVGENSLMMIVRLLRRHIFPSANSNQITALLEQGGLGPRITFRGGFAIALRKNSRWRLKRTCRGRKEGGRGQLGAWASSPGFNPGAPTLLLLRAAAPSRGKVFPRDATQNCFAGDWQRQATLDWVGSFWAHLFRLAGSFSLPRLGTRTSYFRVF